MADEIWEARRSKLEASTRQAITELLDHVNEPALAGKIEHKDGREIYFVAGDLPTVIGIVTGMADEVLTDAAQGIKTNDNEAAK
jgi:hypothetical protein